MPGYRPSGILHWVLPKLRVDAWALIGCIGTEERSFTAWKTLCRLQLLSATQLVRVAPESKNRHAQKNDALWQQSLAEFKKQGGDQKDINEVKLLVPYGQIVQWVDDFLSRGHENIVVDISGLPKRFFFPIVRRILDHIPLVKNIVATYTRAGSYPDAPLAENPADWDHLPLFSGRAEYKPPSPQALVIGVGFEPLGLQGHVEQGDLPLKLLLPFPSPPQEYRRSWELARLLQKNRKPEHVRLFRTHPYDPSDTFDRLTNLTQGGKSTILLAPYGPKPMSLGMCLFARLTETAAYYTQPVAYLPNYSESVAMLDGQPLTYAYCLRLQERDVFAIPTP